jgi:hypothetical protein
MTSPADHRRLFPLAVRCFGLLVGLVLICFAAVPVHASACFFGEDIIIVYYSSAAHTQVVGTCATGPCPGSGCTGKKTSFTSEHTGGLCEVCIP